MKHTLPFLVITFLALSFWMPDYGLAARQQQADQRTVRLDIFERSWIEASVNGKSLFAGIMEAESTRLWSGQDVWIKIGNAGGVNVTVDGEWMGTLGEQGEVVTRRWQGFANLSANITPISPPTLEAPVFAEEEISITPQRYYVVKSGDTLYRLAYRFNVRVDDLLAANQIDDARRLQPGMRLTIPAPLASSIPDRPRGSMHERMTTTSRHAAANSPYYNTTWLTYYGRPDVPVMGILGEYSVDELASVLRDQAEAYDEANGAELSVMPAFHLVYGMATREPGEDRSYLSYLPDEKVMRYIDKAAEEGMAVILDIQVGALSPLEAMERSFHFLKYDNVHLALDPEFAMSHPKQKRPGNPIGFITAQQVNEIQLAMRHYMKTNQIRGRRILVIHQFMDAMLVNQDQLERVYKIDLTIIADGWGSPWAKIDKYNSLAAPHMKFTGLKLFYRWDDPLLTEREVLGIDRYPELDYINITPNMVIYQ